MTPRVLIAIALFLLLLGGCTEHRGHAANTEEHAEHSAVGRPTTSAPTGGNAEKAAAPLEHANHTGDEASKQEKPAKPAAGADSAHQHAQSDQRTPQTTPEGYTNIVLDHARARGLGLTTAPVESREFTRSLRTVGVVALDETRTSHVHSKVRGWIETVKVDFTGKQVRSGQPLLTIYSQEVYAAELEFLSILQQPALGAGLSNEFAAAERQARERLVAGARQRLALWDVPRAEIARLERTRTPRRTFTLISPRTGIVLAKQALAGMFIDPSLELYLISDVRKVWVVADVYDTDVPFVKLGAAAKLWIEGGGPEPVHAKVAFISPTIEEATRTLKVRFEVDNVGERLRPGAFVTVQMDLSLGPGLSLPEDAVIHTGPRAIVFVVHGERIEPREVQLGPNVGGLYRIEKGVVAGEHVATGAQFLLDSESRLRASSAPGGAHAGH